VSTTANRRSVCTMTAGHCASSSSSSSSQCRHRRTFLWRWSSRPSPWKPISLSLPAVVMQTIWVYVYVQILSEFSGSWAIKFTTFPLPSLPDFDLWNPLTLKTFSTTMNICAKFYWNPSTNYTDLLIE